MEFGMLSREDNETLVRVGPGTPMGRLMRLHWIPFLRSSDVERDAQPHRVRLLGEDLVVQAVYADEGPTLKRFQPRAMGRATRIRKRTSHLTITLTPKG